MGMKKQRIKRMKKEHMELLCKIKLAGDVLYDFSLARRNCLVLPMSQKECDQLSRQMYYMTCYQQTLARRIELAGGEVGWSEAAASYPRTAIEHQRLFRERYCEGKH